MGNQNHRENQKEKYFRINDPEPESLILKSYLFCLFGCLNGLVTQWL